MGNPIDDVAEFHDRFGIKTPGHADFMPQDVFNFRLDFMKEELEEFTVAHCCGQAENAHRHNPTAFIDAVDGILDLVYVAFGTLLLMGLPPEVIQACWDDVQRANMTKERAQSSDDPRSKRGHMLDVVKPDGWMPPNHSLTLVNMGRPGPTERAKALEHQRRYTVRVCARHRDVVLEEGEVCRKCENGQW